jgi:hypothetical protein
MEVEQDKFKQQSANKMELDRLKAPSQENLRQSRKGASEKSGNLEDLFRKYNI